MNSKKINPFTPNQALYKCNACANIECNTKNLTNTLPTQCPYNNQIPYSRWSRVENVILTNIQEQAIRTILKRAKAPKEAIDLGIREIVKEIIRITLKS